MLDSDSPPAFRECIFRITGIYTLSIAWYIAWCVARCIAWCIIAKYSVLIGKNRLLGACQRIVMRAICAARQLTVAKNSAIHA